MPCPIDKIQNRFRWRIILKGNIDEKSNAILNRLLREIYNKNLTLEEYLSKNTLYGRN